jgi:hypothetical protein
VFERVGCRAVRVGLASALIALVVVGCAWSAEKPDWSGHWTVRQACTTGACAGVSYSGRFDLVQRGDAITGNAVDTHTGKTIVTPLRGTANGLSATISAAGGIAHLTMSDDKLGFTATWTEHIGGQTYSGTWTGTRTCGGSGTGSPTRSTSSAGGNVYIGDGGKSCPQHSLSLRLAGENVQLLSWTFPYRCQGGTSRNAKGGPGDSGPVDPRKGTFFIAMATAGIYQAHLSGLFKPGKNGVTLVVDSAEIRFDHPPAGCPASVVLDGTIVLHKS